jgi:arylsulfatase
MMNKALTTALVMGGLLNSQQSIYAAESSEHSTLADKSTVAQAGKAKPNVIWILLDDVGFGASSTFGGLVETPNLDALAAQGLRYTNFHTTGISSPTRAAILTGRNHHHVGMGLFPETAVDLPGYNANISPSNGTVAEVFRENGYSTFALGKWHLTPVEQATPAGPFNQWPTGKGFEHYYGFLYGETDQWQPQLV